MKKNIIYAFIFIGLFHKLESSQNRESIRTYWLAISSTGYDRSRIDREGRLDSTFYNISYSTTPTHCKSMFGKLFRGPYHTNPHPSIALRHPENSGTISLYNHITGEYIVAEDFSRLEIICDLYSARAQYYSGSGYLASCALTDAFNFIQENNDEVLMDIDTDME